jgi:hypothetical protein
VIAKVQKKILRARKKINILKIFFIGVIIRGLCGINKVEKPLLSYFILNIYIV